MNISNCFWNMGWYSGCWHNRIIVVIILLITIKEFRNMKKTLLFLCFVLFAETTGRRVPPRRRPLHLPMILAGAGVCAGAIGSIETNSTWTNHGLWNVWSGWNVWITRNMQNITHTFMTSNAFRSPSMWRKSSPAHPHSSSATHNR